MSIMRGEQAMNNKNLSLPGFAGGWPGGTVITGETVFGGKTWTVPELPKRKNLYSESWIKADMHLPNVLKNAMTSSIFAFTTFLQQQTYRWNSLPRIELESTLYENNSKVSKCRIKMKDNIAKFCFNLMHKLKRLRTNRIKSTLKINDFIWTIWKFEVISFQKCSSTFATFDMYMYH